jgi:hypothetical protein
VRTDVEIASWAAAQGFGILKTQAISEDDTRVIIFRNYVPAKPANVICFLEERGLPPEYAYTVGGLSILIELPSIAVIVRNQDNDTARALTEQIYLAAGRVFNTQIVPGGARWESMLPSESPHGDGLDPSHGWFRFRFVIQGRKQPSG